MANFPGRMVVYGGRGSLGSVCVDHFKNAKWWVASIDYKRNEEANMNVIIEKDDPWVSQEQQAVSEIGNSLLGEKLNAIICVAGGWVGGNTAVEIANQAETTWKQSVWPASISASIATKHLAQGGLLVLTGAKAALEKTPRMIGYGMAKAAVHQLAISLGSTEAGLPKNVCTVAILPETLDTERNRKWMPKADFSSWTPLEVVVNLFEKWIVGEDRPISGSLVQLVTRDSITHVTVCDMKQTDNTLKVL